MNKNAKWLVLVLCLTLFAVMFAGCGPQTPGTSATPGPDNTEAAATPTPAPTEQVPEGPKYMKAGETYRVLLWNNTVENQVLEQEGIRGQLFRDAYNMMLDEYDVEPLWIAAPSNWIGDAMESAYAGSPICDLIHIGAPYNVATLYTYNGERGSVIEPISNYDVDFSDPEYWDVSTQSVGTFGGNQYLIVPNGIGFDAVSVNVVTFFNKTLIAKAGYTPEQLYGWSNNGEWTFDKFREVARTCTDLDNGIYGTSTVQNCLLLTTLVAANGSDMIVKKDGKEVFNMLEKKALTAVNFMVEMARDDQSMLVDVYGSESAPFSSGTLALMVTYANRVFYIGNMEDDYGMLMPPKGPDAADYISDKNWFEGYMVMKNTANPAGTVEFANLYLKPGYAASSELQGDLLAAQAATYRLDEQSVEILSKIPAVNHTTSYQIYWSLYVNGETISTLGIYKFPSFVDGSLSPETYYASVEDAANNILESILGL